MKLTYDFHTHTVFSHGKGTILQNAQVAKENGILGIGITDHGFNHPAFGMRRRKLPEMKRLCKEAQDNTGVDVLLGVEANLLGESGKTDVKESDYEFLDLFLAGCHRFVMYDKLKEWFTFFGENYFASKFHFEPTKELIDRTTKIYIKAIENNPIDIITHVNFLVFADAVEVAKCARDYGTYFEINTKKTHLSVDEWQKVIDTGVNFVIDSDAHSPQRVGEISLAENLFEKVDFPVDRIHNINGKIPTLRFSEFKKRL